RAPPLRVGPVVLDLARHEVCCRDAVLRLTVTEFGLLAALMERPGVVLSRAQLMERAYAYDNLITERTIDTHVKRVRRKFRDAGHDPIETVHGVGYKLREA
ncbi:MAG: two-component response regulator, partial [Myxococcaceae bacterium]|nr:two-component response regulator [Myxococcaceae bacterium]